MRNSLAEKVTGEDVNEKTRVDRHSSATEGLEVATRRWQKMRSSLASDGLRTKGAEEDYPPRPREDLSRDREGSRVEYAELRYQLRACPCHGTKGKEREVREGGYGMLTAS